MPASKPIGWTKEYREGWQAYHDQISRDGNPYADGDNVIEDKASLWWAGWAGADQLSRDNEDNEPDPTRDDPTQH